MAYDRKILYKNSKPPYWAYILGGIFLIGFIVAFIIGRSMLMLTNGAACAACIISVVAWHKSGKGNQKEYKKKLSQTGEEELLSQVNNNCLLSKVKDDTAFFITDKYTFLAGSFLIKTDDIAWFYVLPEGAANLICVADKSGDCYSGKTALLSLKAELEPKVREVLPHVLIGYSKETEKQYNKKYSS